MAEEDTTHDIQVDVLPSGKLTSAHLRRADVVSAFHCAFQMIGGIPRLALWADHNPGDFYKLYSRLLPSAASDELNGVTQLEIVHALPPPKYNPAQALELSKPELTTDPVPSPDEE